MDIDISWSFYSLLAIERTESGKLEKVRIVSRDKLQLLTPV